MKAQMVKAQMVEAQMVEAQPLTVGQKHFLHYLAKAETSIERQRLFQAHGVALEIAALGDSGVSKKEIDAKTSDDFDAAFGAYHSRKGYWRGVAKLYRRRVNGG